MAKNYLDKTGLSYFWSKIKSYISNASVLKATNDSTNQQINTTYIKDISIEGTTLKYTKGDNTTSTQTTQDTIYSLPVASSTELGGIKIGSGLSISDDGVLSTSEGSSGGGSFDEATIFLIAHPIGSYYWSDNSASPADLYGGTWERIKDRFLWAAGDNDVIGNTGGEKTHKLTISEIPSHNHGVSIVSANNVWGPNYSNGISHKESTKNVGGGQAHNNMPPYLVTYCWKRTA